MDRLNQARQAIQSDAALVREIASRDLTFKRDIDALAILGVTGDEGTVHRVAVAVSQAGGAGRATAENINAQLNAYAGFDEAYLSRIPGDVSVERGAPGLYLNTLLNGRTHVDTTMLYLATMSDRQFDQLSSYVGSVVENGGLINYKQNETLVGLVGLQGSTTAMGRLGDGLSVAGLGLRNLGRGMLETIGHVDPSTLGNGTIGKLLYSPMIRPMYVVPPGPSAAAATQAAAARSSNTTRTGTVRTNAQDWREVRDLWDDIGYGDILSSANRSAIAKSRTPRVDADWVKVFPEDAGLMGERISMHHIGGLPLTVPWPATRHLNAHMPGGFRYNPGGPGSALPSYPPKP